MAGKEIRVLASDRGGWNALEPALLLALQAGCNVHTYFTGTCKEQFEAGKLHPHDRIQLTTGSNTMADMESVFGTGTHDLLVVGASQSDAGATAAWHALVHSHPKPSLIVEDMYGSSRPILKRGVRLVDRICVIDEYAQHMILHDSPKLSSIISVTGGPQFDKVVGSKQEWQARRQSLREILGLQPETIVFLVAGGLNGTAEILELIEDGVALAKLGKQTLVIVHTHARATAEDQRAVQQYRATSRLRFKDVDVGLVSSSVELLPAADYVCTGYSTTNHFAVLLEMPGVVYFGTPLIKQDLMAEKGLERPPEVEAQAAWYVESADHLARAIQEVRRGVGSDEVIRIQDAQRAIARYNDGRAAERVWQEMQTLMDR